MSTSSCSKNPKRLRILACMLLVASFCSVMPAAAAGWRDELPQAKPIGSGTFRWFGFKIYNAKLWSERDPFDVNAPFALELTYHRSISRQQFVETSLDEIKRLFGNRYPPHVLAQWEAEMNRAFPDVVAGDQLIGIYQPEQGCRFYNAKQLTADIRDPEFARAFFSIWLDQRSKDKDLRAQLLGTAK